MEGGQAGTVLVLSASYGSGHNQVAQAVRQALIASWVPSVSLLDHFETFVRPTFDRVTRGLYFSLLKTAPGLWGLLYDLSDSLPVHSRFMFGMNHLGKRRLARYLAEARPAVVVSVHPTPAGAVSALKAEGVSIAHVTVFTDFVVHTQWVYPHVERYCVPCEDAALSLEARGIERERIVVTGVPIRDRFFRTLDRGVLRSKYGLRKDQPVVLVMAGARATVGGLSAVLRVLRSLPVNCQGVFVCGHDHILVNRLSRLAGPQVRVFGYVEAVEELMALSDVLVTKAGAVTLSEAIVMDLPLVLFHSLPGQERANQRYLEEAGAAITARSEKELSRALQGLLTDPVLSEKLRSNLRRMRRPDPAGAVAQEILALRQ